MISVVNGYVCTSSCEAASAKQGKDPHATPGTSTKSPGFDGQPATVLGGALQDIAATGSTGPANKSSVNLLA